MPRIGRSGLLAFVVAAAIACVVACSADRSTGDDPGRGPGDGGLDIGSGLDGGSFGGCGTCLGTIYTSCADGGSTTTKCPAACTPNVGCTACSPEGTMCVGNEVHRCSGDGVAGDLVTTCDAAKGELCNGGACRNGCELSKDEPSNLGCEFYAVDLDLSDGVSDPASGPWGVVLANGGTIPATVNIERNDAPLGSPLAPKSVYEGTIAPNNLVEVKLVTREVDCADKPGSWTSPGTCVTSNAYRITSTAPIVVYQFNNLSHGYSTDASLLMPTSSVGTKYRVTGWPVAHSFPSPGAFVQRSYVTVVGTVAGTVVTVKPKWRIKGNASIPATPAGGTITVTMGPFDVLNLESDDATLSECLSTKPPYCADLTGSIVEATQPIVVFSGTEESGVGLPEGAPKPPSWGPDSNGCCNQHLEEQLFPVESFGRKFLVTRSPVRSNPEFTSWEEPDVIRFVGAAVDAKVTTNLPAPFDSFTLKPGEVLDAWAQKDFTVDASEPIVVAQFLVGEGYVEPSPKGDPSFTIFPPIEQARTDYVFLSPADWKENFVVIGTEKGNTITVDGAPTSDCLVKPAGALDGKEYEARRCKLSPGVHRLSGTGRFQIMAYGYSDADAYSFAGGANVKKIYAPPPLR
jgi:hypothetical protein